MKTLQVPARSSADPLLLHEVFQASPIGIVLADFDGCLLFANQAFCSTLGFRAEEIRSKKWVELSPSEDAAKDQALFEKLRAGSTYHYHLDKHCLRRDGSLFLGHWSVWRLNSRVLLAMITDKGQTELALHEAEEHFRNLADKVPAMIWMSGVDKLCTYVNQPWLDFTGRSLEAEMGNGWAQGVHPDDSRKCLETYTRAFDGREPFQMEYRLRRHDGEYRWVLGSGVPRFGLDGSFAGYVGSAINITELKRAMTILQESEDRFRLVANTAPVLIWMSGVDKLCVYFNQPWLDFTGRSLEAEMGNGWAQGVHSDDSRKCLETYTRAFDGREPFQMEYRLRRHDGEYRWILDRGVPRFNPDGSFAGYIGSCVDITEQKLAEEALSTVSQRLIQAHEEERARIARELHDDINQRVALLSVKLDSLNQNLPAAAAELRREIGAASQQVTELGSDVQALSHRLHSSKLQYLGLAAAANGFCGELSDRSGIRIEFTSENLPNQVPEEVSLCLFRVLQEALQNAVKHSGSRHFEVSLKGGTSGVELIVHDGGIGFESEEAIKGRGLGLTSMKERLKLVGGELSIDSKPQHGTTIRARCPSLAK